MNLERVCYGCFEEKEPGAPCPRCGFNERDEQPYLALPLGAILNGRYLVGKVLGIGGFGITYLGYDLTLEIKVAIKEYMPSALATRHPDHYSVALTGPVEADYQYGMERFLDEARILARLNNAPHIVSVQNYFKENGTAYFVMEYIEGMSLKAHLEKNGGRLSCDRAIAVLQPIMEALVQVHGMNLLHRDISPDNIYLTAQGDSRLLDFGAARFALGDGKSVSVILKHGYAPEEQYSSHGNQGPWTDVYAMGATLYRCITGQLPPDSVERIHGDTLKTPSELGVRIPANVESALMKALAVKTEDRFPNMEAFLAALKGRVPVEDQVAASIHQRTQAAYGQTAYQQPAHQQPSALSRFLSYLKATPVVARVAGGGLAVVLALCIILPLALSGGEKEPLESGDKSATSQTSVTEPETPEASPSTSPSEMSTEQPTEQPTELVERELGFLNATIKLPPHYEAMTEDGLNFVNTGKDGGGGCTIMINYAWDEIFPLFGSWEAVGPIYSLVDVESQQDAIVSRITSDTATYQILAAGPEQVGGRDAYRIHYETTNNEGKVVLHTILAIQEEGFGCFFIYVAYSQGDAALEAEIEAILQSFQRKDAPDTTYSMYYAENCGIQIILDDAVAGERVKVKTIDKESIGEVHEIVVYPTDAAMENDFGEATEDTGGMEILDVGQLRISSPEEYIQSIRDSVVGLDITLTDNYTTVLGGVEWLCMDETISGFTFRNASAMIDGRCFGIRCVMNDTNSEAVNTLFTQAMSTLRAWRG